MKGRTILVVEDNPITRKMLRLALESDGHGVIEAGDGKTAIAAALGIRPDLVIVDYVLPDTDGLSLLAKIRAELESPMLPVLVVSGMVTQLEDLGLRAGSNVQMLSKPVEPTQLLAAIRAHLAPALADGLGRRVLVVDDEEPNRKLAAIRLEQMGYRVETAAGGVEALAAARRLRPDAVLSDVLMPGMDGFILCAELAADPELASVPVVLVSSAYVEDTDQEFARLLGARALVLRTPDLEPAISAVRDALSGVETAGLRPKGAPLTALHRERIQAQLDRQMANNQRLLRQSAIQSTALSVIRGVSEALVETKDVQRVIGEVLVQCLDAAGLSTGLLYTVGEAKGLNLQAQFGIPADRRAEAEQCFGHGAQMRKIVERGTPVALLADGSSASEREILERMGHSSALVVPFNALGDRLGFLLLASDAHDLSDEAWTGFARSLAAQFGQTLALSHSLSRLAASELRYRALMEQANDGIVILDMDYRVLEANQEAERMLGFPRAEFIGRLYEDFVDPSDREDARRQRVSLTSAGTLRVQQRTLVRADGSRLPVELSASLVLVPEDDDRPVVLAIMRDLTERLKSEAGRIERARLAAFAGELNATLAGTDSLPTMLEGCIDRIGQHLGAPLAWVWTVDNPDGLTVRAFLGGAEPEGMAPPWLEAAAGRVAAEAVSWVTNDVLHDAPPADREGFAVAGLVAFACHPLLVEGELLGVLAVGNTRPLSQAASLALGHAAESIALGIKRKQAEDLLVLRDLQLRQSQKLEAIGKLAGGVAHDFNNLLAVIGGYAEMTIRQLEPGDPSIAKIDQILRATERATELTKQLLAFGRKQVLQPRVLDLRDVLSEIEPMLRRLIGEDIEFVSVVRDRIGLVRADPGQIGQVLLNLLVNARDAMPRGGRVTVELANVDLDPVYARRNAGVEPGSYVLLAVSDTGAGMSPEIATQVFEPFFTTKEPGKGTGLGLATVHGIIKQSEGHITVYSEPGQGATFKVYLPRLPEAAELEAGHVPEAEPPRGTESVLLVEDETTLRMMIREYLEEGGYDVHEAQSPAHALELAGQPDLALHAMMTDVVMPGMSGRELAERLAVIRPAMRVIYMSGYTDDAVVLHGVLSANVEFLQKPFSRGVLLRKLRHVLDAP